MPDIEKSAVFAAEPAAVWAVVADPARFEEWLVLHRGWRGEVPERFGAGTRSTALLGVLGLSLPVTWTVAEWQPDRRVQLTGAAPAGVDVGLDLVLVPKGGATVMTLTATFSGALVAGAIGDAVGRAVSADLDRSSARLAELVT